MTLNIWKYLSPADFRNPKIREKIIADIGKLNDNLNLLPEKFFKDIRKVFTKANCMKPL